MLSQHGGLECLGPGPRLGLGCMGMSWGYGESTRDDLESRATITTALDEGVRMIDTAVIYGDGHNESLVGRAIRGRRHEVYLASKGGLVVDDLAAKRMHHDGSAANLNAQIDASLKRLGTDHIDLYYLHRVDPNVDLRVSVEALGTRVLAGDIGGIGLSEVSLEQAMIAQQIHPVRAIQSELSLWTRDAQGSPSMATTGGAPHHGATSSGDIVSWAEVHDVAFVAFAPLGRGFLTGAIASPEELEEGDFRKSNPRFMPDAFRMNQEFLRLVRAIATARDATVAQVALAWVLAQGNHVLPIPGSRRTHHLRENIGATSVRLTDIDLDALNRLQPPAGSRY